MKDRIESAGGHSKSRLAVILHRFLLLTVASIFLGSDILTISVPFIGTLFPFRILLPITAVLYLIWAAKGEDHPWRDSSALEKWCYVLIGIMLVYGAISLAWALDVVFSLRRLWNLCFDLCFFFLLLRLCRNKQTLRAVITVAMIGWVAISILGIYEAFHHGVFSTRYDSYKRMEWFFQNLQFPVVTSGNTNDYASALLYVSAVFLAACGFGVFDGKNRVVGYVPIFLMPVLLFLITMSSSRLTLAAFWVLLFAWLISNAVRKDSPGWISVITVIAVIGVIFCHQYRYVVPPIQNYIVEMREYNAWQEAQKETAVQSPTDVPEQPGAPTIPETPDLPDTPELPPVEKPTLEIGNQKEPSLEAEFYETTETGEKVLGDVGSGGVRLLLLLHAADCFVESRGLGVGLGNTEVLAAERAVVPKWADQNVNSIHCFIARIIADYGIFVLIPLCAIALLLLRNIWALFRRGCRANDRKTVAAAILLFGCAIIYPAVSTASSDAQDSLYMWFYLVAIVVFAGASRDQKLFDENMKKCGENL